MSESTRSTVTASFSEPRDGPLEDTRCGCGFLVVADLDIGDAGVVIDDGAQKRGANDCAATFAAHSGPVGGRDRVRSALLTADELMPAAIGDIAELGDVDADHRPRARMFVAADWLTDDSVDMTRPGWSCEISGLLVTE